MPTFSQKNCRVLLIDNFDSFTFNIADYLRRAGAEVRVISRESVREIDMKNADGIVFSPGPGNPEKIPLLMKLIAAATSLKPVLGICLGHQALALHFGASLRKAEPMHGKISAVDSLVSSPLLRGIPVRFRVVRYHSIVVEKTTGDLIPLLETESKLLMAFVHRTLPVMGVQFHPEAHLTEFGLQLLKNWLDVCVKNQAAIFQAVVKMA